MSTCSILIGSLFSLAIDTTTLIFLLFIFAMSVFFFSISFRYPCQQLGHLAGGSQDRRLTTLRAARERERERVRTGEHDFGLSRSIYTCTDSDAYPTSREQGSTHNLLIPGECAPPVFRTITEGRATGKP